MHACWQTREQSPHRVQAWVRVIETRDILAEAPSVAPRGHKYLHQARGRPTLVSSTLPKNRRTSAVPESIARPSPPERPMSLRVAAKP